MLDNKKPQTVSLQNGVNTVNQRMGRLIAVVVACVVLLFSGIWGYRLVGPHLTERQAGEAARAAADSAFPKLGSVVIGATYYGDTSKLVTRQGYPILVTLSPCPSWFPAPAALCPPLSAWVVRVHTPGQPDNFFLVDATSGDTEELPPGEIPR
jgi:hypothetical protein